MEKMKKKTAGLIAIVAIVAVAMFAGCVEEEKPVPVTTPTSQTTSSYDDDYFKDWCVGLSTILGADLDAITQACNNYDLETLEEQAALFYEDTEEALGEIDQFDVSPEMQPVKAELKLALEDCKKAADYAERGAKNSDADDLERSSDYLDSGTEHLNKVTELLEK